VKKREEQRKRERNDEMMAKYEIWESNMEERRKEAEDMVVIKESKEIKLFCPSSVTGHVLVVI
jgi:hypothetical protein